MLNLVKPQPPPQKRNERIYSSLRDFRDKVEELYRTGITRGSQTGFPTLDQHWSIKRGVTTYIYGAPFSGKSEFIFENLVNLTEFHGWHHALFSPESGSREEVAAEIISKKCRQPFYRQFDGHLSEDQLIRELDWFGEYFYIIDPNEADITQDDFYAQVDMIENENAIRIDSTVIDPFNELKHSMGDLRQDLYIEERLGAVRRNARTFNRHNFIVTHTANQDLIKGKDSLGAEIWYYPPPTPEQISGGKAWYRKAMNLICVWRPPPGMITKEGEPADDNEVHIMIQKYKPKMTGKRGTVRMYYDTATNRYFEKLYGDRRYAGIGTAEPPKIDYLF